MICKRIVYSGHVQGVGFRYTTHGLAEHYAVSGYVRNLRGGDVELVVQGEPEEIDRFLTALESRMTGHIAGKEAHEQACADFKGFTIRMM